MGSESDEVDEEDDDEEEEEEDDEAVTEVDDEDEEEGESFSLPPLAPFELSCPLDEPVCQWPPLPLLYAAAAAAAYMSNG